MLHGCGILNSEWLLMILRACMQVAARSSMPPRADRAQMSSAELSGWRSTARHLVPLRLCEPHLGAAHVLPDNHPPST